MDSFENPQFSTQVSDSENPHFNNLDEVGLSTSTEPSFKRSRGGNFSMEEDVLIVSGWLNISLDAVQGNDQKRKKYWARVLEYFNKYKTFESDRTRISLMNRWSAIQSATNKFCGCYSKIEARPRSGTNEQDKISDAKLLYKSLYDCKFQFEHCWNILRHQQKWMEDCERKKTTKKKEKRATTLETLVNLEDDSVQSSGPEHVARPPGRKAEKEKQKKRRKDTDNESSESCVKLLQEMKEDKKLFNKKKLEIFEKVYVQGQERLSFEKEKLRLEQMKEDKRIMVIDTSGLHEKLANFYQQRQEEIMQRMSKGF